MYHYVVTESTNPCASASQRRRAVSLVHAGWVPCASPCGEALYRRRAATAEFAEVFAFLASLVESAVSLVHAERVPDASSGGERLD